MRNILVVLVLFFVAVPLSFASTQAAKTPAPKAEPTAQAPVIPDSQSKDFFKARANILEIQTVTQQRQAALQKAVNEMQETCAKDKDYTLSVSQDGDPVCTKVPAKHEATTPPKK